MIYPRPGYDAQKDPRAWLDDEEIALLAAVDPEAAKVKITVKPKGGPAREVRLSPGDLSTPAALLGRIATLRYRLHNPEPAAVESDERRTP